MNGFEQIKSFYSFVFNNPNNIRPTHISLYLFLLNQNNRSMWVEWFKCPYDLAMQGACIGNKNTYYKCLDDLQSYKLIEYKKGINNHKSPLIKLIRLYESEPLTGQVTVPQSEPQTVPQPEPLSVLLNKNTYKLITDNYLTLNLKQKEVCDFISKISKKNDEEIKYPTLEEFIKFGIDKKTDVDLKALELKYYSWSESNWYTGSNPARKIKNWKSTLLNTLPHLKTSTEKQKPTFKPANRPS